MSSEFNRVLHLGLNERMFEAKLCVLLERKMLPSREFKLIPAEILRNKSTKRLITKAQHLSRNLDGF